MMKMIKIKNWQEIPDGFTGIVKCLNGTKIWFQNGRLHRLDGPAVEWDDKSREYWALGTRLAKDEFKIFQRLWGRTLLDRSDKLMKIFIELSTMGGPISINFRDNFLPIYFAASEPLVLETEK